MRFLFLIPDLDRRWREQLTERLGHSRLLEPLRRVKHHLMASAEAQRPERVPMRIGGVAGGTLNIMRHAMVARSLGVDVAMATESGRDTYGPRWGLEPLTFVRWSDRRADDVCIVPDIYTYLIPEIKGFAVAYLQSPLWLSNDFDHLAERVVLWTDSPFLLERCGTKYPGKPATMVPNVIDANAFPFIPQSQRRRGELIAFPRKGHDFIDAVWRAYRSAGGTYWRLQTLHGLPFHEFAARLHTPQAFLASSNVEGCALPPLEAMAAGIAVVGRDAAGANFYMQHEQTALVANDVAEAAAALRRLEQDQLREKLTMGGYKVAQRWFPENEPTAFWRKILSKGPWAADASRSEKRNAVGHG